MSDYGKLPAKFRFFLLTLGGLMLGLSFPPFHTGVLAAFAFVPFFIVFEDIESYGGAFRSSYVMFFVLSLVSLTWVGGFTHAKDPYLMVAGASLVFGHPLFMFVPVMAFVAIRKHLGFKASAYAFPFIWTAFEYLHSITQFAFPWLLLGNSHTYDTQSIQFASVTGVYGVSFWLACMNVAAYVVYASVAVGRWRINSWQSVLAVLVLVVMYFVPKLYGSLTLDAGILEDGRIVRVGIVQPNIDPFEKWQENAGKELATLRSVTERVRRNATDLVLWPETALPFFILSPRYEELLDSVRRQVDSLGTGLLTGMPDIVYYRDAAQAPANSRVVKGTGQRYDLFNCSMLVQPRSSEIQKYSKINLVPFAERVPYADVLAFSPSLLQWNLGLGGWGIGTDTTIFRLRLSDSSTVKFANLICYESIYPGFVAAFVKKGAQFLTVITNDSWWGNTFGPYQHVQIAVFRAIENRRWVVQCANGGISCFIDPLGNIIQRTDMYTIATPVGEVKARTGLTFYSKHGDVFAQTTLWISLMILAAAVGKKFYIVKRRADDAHD